jgi:hypothetical protein
MAPPRRIDRPSRIEIHLPESLHAKLKLELYSEAEGRVPKGRASDLVVELLTDWLSKRGIS